MNAAAEARVARSDALAREIGLAERLGSDEAVQLLSGNATPPVGQTLASVYAVPRSPIRAFLCSRAMHHLGALATRALAVTGSPQPVRRETIETAAVVTRVAPTFIRFGHFEQFAHAADDRAPLQRLNRVDPKFVRRNHVAQAAIEVSCSS